MNKPIIICLVDDDEIYQFTFTKSLEKSKVSKRVLVFGDGEEAIDFISANLNDKESLPDLIFLDINMPVMDGWDFLEEYLQLRKGINKNITIYIVSSSVHEEDIERAKKISEVTDYLVKPISEAEVHTLIELISGQLH